jgi:hypothetical protein
MNELVIPGFGAYLRKGRSKLMWVNGVVWKHIVMARDRHSGLYLGRQIGRFPVGQIVKSSINASNH